MYFGTCFSFLIDLEKCEPTLYALNEISSGHHHNPIAFMEMQKNDFRNSLLNFSQRKASAVDLCFLSEPLVNTEGGMLSPWNGLSDGLLLHPHNTNIGCTRHHLKLRGGIYILRICGSFLGANQSNCPYLLKDSTEVLLR